MADLDAVRAGKAERDGLLSAIGTIRGVFEGLRETAEDEAAQADLAALEAHLLPGEGPLRALERYERHLQRALLGAVAELERAISGRRVREAVRRWWGR